MDLSSQMSSRTPTAPRFNVRPLTPSDTDSVKDMFGVDMVNISIATAGTIHYIDGAGHEDTAAFPAGVFPGWFQKIFADGTDAEGLVAIW